MKKMVNRIMKKNYLLLIAASVALAFTACSTKEFDLPEDKNPGVTQEMKHISLSATTENDNNTKVTLVGTAYGWSAGVDKVKVTTTEGLVESGAYSAGHFELTYSGSRDGYAVVPSSFLTAADGSNLTITYPSSYDISSYITDSYLDGGKYDAAGAYLPIPMIATSTEGESMLTFYALGALVRVTVSDVPVGTKKLYITFNQTVTGDFAVTSPTPGTSQVVVADTSTPSTVEFTISDTGITAEQAANSFVLYIPVPTTSGLGIASSATTKATVARNRGYAWAVDAITHTGDGSIATNDGTFIFAPGNLLVHKVSGVLEYSFEDPVISTRGELSDDPHVSGGSGIPATAYSPTLLSDLVEGKYQDVFNSLVLREIVGDHQGEGTPNYNDGNDEYYDTHLNYVFQTNAISINGKSWRVPSLKFWDALNYTHEHEGSRTGRQATVRDKKASSYANVLVDVSGNDERDGYAVYSGKYVCGRLFFPDGYVDQTDLLSELDFESLTDPNGKTPPAMTYNYYKSWAEVKNIISSDVLDIMLSQGAAFLSASAGLYAGGWANTGSTAAGYYLGDWIGYKTGIKTGTFAGWGYNLMYSGGAAYAVRQFERSCLVRLVRDVE